MQIKAEYVRFRNEVQFESKGHYNLKQLFLLAYLLLLCGIVHEVCFEEWVFFMHVVVHPFTEMISNIKPSRVKTLAICKK